MAEAQTEFPGRVTSIDKTAGGLLQTVTRSLRQFAPALVLGLTVAIVSVWVLWWGPPHAASSHSPAAWEYIFNLAAFIFFIGCIVAVIPVARQELDNNNAFVCGLVATAALVPTTVAEVSTVAAYVFPLVPSASYGWMAWVNRLALLIGALAGLLAWVVWATFYRHLATAARQNASIYAKLRENYTELRAGADAIVGVRAGDLTLSESATLNAVQGHLDAVRDDLGLPGGERSSQAEPGQAGTGVPKTRSLTGMRWVLATGYIDQWNRLHAAEEGLLMLAPREEVVRAAVHDAQRLQESAIPNATQYLGVLRIAVQCISPSATRYLDQLLTTNAIGLHLPASQQVNGSTATATISSPAAQDGRISAGEPATSRGWWPWRARKVRSGGAGTQSATVSAPPQQAPASPASLNGQRASSEEEQEARGMVRQVRRVINEFRDTRWEQLVRQRNHLLEAVVFTRITSYGLLALAIIFQVRPATILGAAVFYFVGALTALFNRLRSPETPGSEVEDYGLTSATLIQTTPFSGLAAVGGVLLSGLLAVSLSATNGTGRAAGGVATYNLMTIFDLQRDPFGLVTAAVFGLTPTLLISRLQQVSDRYKSDLKSTASSENAATSPKRGA